MVDTIKDSWHLKLLRNKAAFATKAAALAGVETKFADAKIEVGTPFVASWAEGEKKGVILAIKAVGANQIFDMDGTSQEIDEKIQKAIEALDVEVVGGSETVKSTFVKNIKQEDGKIIAEADTLTSSDKTVVIDDFDLSVNIDNKTLVKSDDGVISVAPEATVVNGENAIVVSDIENEGKKVALKIKDGDKFLSQSDNGLTAEFSFVKVSASSANVLEEYELQDKDGNKVGDSLKVYKDKHLKDVEFDADSQALTFTYVLMDGTESPVSVDLSAFIAESEYADGLQVADHKISVKIDATSEDFLSVGTDGVKLSGVQEAIDNARTEVKAANDDAHVTVTSADGENGQKIYTVKTIDVASDSATTESLDAIKEAVGLGDEYGHVATSGNYTSGASTIAGEIAALDTQVKENADAIKANKLEAADGSIVLVPSAEKTTVKVGFSAEAGNMLDNKADGLYLTNIIDCGEY